ncbi:MBL fold metallo-hydrolase [Patescibacteria group bacterium]|nr:MBL fold metallo-hydrolase [Patescibacteria group bacterium]
MTIIYYGLTCFRFQNNGLSLLIDPLGRDSGLNPPRMQNDLVLLSRGSKNKDYSSNTFAITCPGEYELKGCFVYGIPVTETEKEDKLMFLIELEGIKIAYLGLLKNPKLTDTQLEKLEGADILILPVGGGDSLNEKQAVETANQLEPRLIIPMYYQIPKIKLKLEPLDKFKKEIAIKSEIVDKLKITKRELPQEETRLVIINPLL